MKNNKLMYAIIFLVVGVLAIAAFGLYVVFFKPHRSVDDERAIQVTAVQLFNDFESDEVNANQRYLDKVVEITGQVADITTDMERHPVVTLATDDILFGVRCTLAENQPGLQTGDTIRVKGICKGFLSDVVVTDGILKK